MSYHTTHNPNLTYVHNGKAPAARIVKLNLFCFTEKTSDEIKFISVGSTILGKLAGRLFGLRTIIQSVTRQQPGNGCRLFHYLSLVIEAMDSAKEGHSAFTDGSPRLGLGVSFRLAANVS